MDIEIINKEFKLGIYGFSGIALNRNLFVQSKINLINLTPSPLLTKERGKKKGIYKFIIFVYVIK
jgi:hypothetical protein